MRGLALRQPWLAAIMYGGKRVENRLKWKGCSYRGNVVLHAASGMTRAEYLEVIHFLHTRGIVWRPDLPQQLLFSALAVKTKIIDVIMPGGFKHLAGAPPSFKSTEKHPMGEDRWYMGKFALVLDSEIEILPKPIPYKGKLGLFKIDAKVEELIREQLAILR